MSRPSLMRRTKKKDVKECIEKIGRKDSNGAISLSFQDILPPPQYLHRGKVSRRELREKYGYTSDISWFINNWGGVDGAQDVFFDEKNNTFHFMVNGEEPYPVIHELSRRFPSIIFVFKSAYYPFPSAWAEFIECLKFIKGDVFGKKGRKWIKQL